MLVARGLFGCFLALAAGHVDAREFHLSRDRDLFTLVASNAPLADVLREMEAALPSAIRFYGEPTQRVTGAYRAIPLETLLDRLGVTYALTYAPDEGGTYRLEQAGVMQQADPLVPPLPLLTRAQSELARRAVADLRSDDIPGNASRAVGELFDLGCGAAPYLEEALASDDLQQRQVAGQILRSMCSIDEPSDRQLMVTLEVLRGATYNYDLSFLTGPSSGFDLLRGNSNAVKRVEKDLLANLDGEDRQARVLSALLLAEHHYRDLTPVLAPILVPHLADNRIPSDGGLAAHALYQMGPAVRPYLEPLLESDDEQQRDLVRLILHQLDHPDDTHAALANPMINSTVRNPVLSETEMIGWWSDEGRFPDEQGNYREHDEQDEGDGCEVKFTYTPRRGESLKDVAWAFGVSLESLAALNGLPASPGLITTNTLSIPVLAE